MASLARIPKIGQGFMAVLRQIRAIPPNKDTQKEIGKIMASDTKVVFTSVVCPDYSAQRQGGEMVYSFDSLGAEVGVVGNRALEVHLRLSKFFKENGLDDKVRFVLAIADQEANDSNCQRVKVSQEEFLARLRKSQQCLAAKAERAGLVVETPLLTEINSGLWLESQKEARNLVDKVSSGVTNEALKARRLFYDRWSGRRLSSDEALAMLKVQVEEYVCVGKYLSTNGRVILGLDAPVMAPFVRHGAQKTPVIYFDRPEY